MHCDGVSLETLARKYGTPLYVYSATQIVERLGMFQQAFAGREHLGLLCGEGELVAGDFEAAGGAGCGVRYCFGRESWSGCWRLRLRRSGAWCFPGVGKTAAEIDRALEAGILEFNVESEAELALLAARARKLKRRARFALRVNPDVFAETHPYISTGLREHKFGIDIRQARRRFIVRRPGTSGWRRMGSACISGRRSDRRSRLARRWSG